MNFFAHENQACLPSPSNMGKLQLGTKSDIVGCLEKLVPSTREDSLPDVSHVMCLLLMLLL